MLKTNKQSQKGLFTRDFQLTNIDAANDQREWQRAIYDQEQNQQHDVDVEFCEWYFCQF